MLGRSVIGPRHDAARPSRICTLGLCSVPQAVTGTEAVRRPVWGLCVSGWGGQEHGDGRGGMLAMVAQVGADLADAGRMQQAERGAAQQGHGRGPLATMDRARILAQGHILEAV